MNYWSATRCKELIDSNQALAIDIREPYEFTYVNCGFKNIPMAELTSFLSTHDRSLPIILMCQSGRRAQAAGNLIETELGFTQVIILEDGIQGWKNEIDQTLKLD